MNNFLTKGDQPFIYQLKLIYSLRLLFGFARNLYPTSANTCYWAVILHVSILSLLLDYRVFKLSSNHSVSTNYDMNWPSNLLSRSATPISMTLDVLIQAVCLYTRHHNAKRSAKTRILFGRKQSISAWTLTVCAMIHTISWQRSIRMALWKLASQFMRYVHYYNHV